MKNYKLNSNDALLLVIDIQERLLPVMQNSKEIIKNSKILLESAKVLNIPIIATEQYPKGLGSTIEELKLSLDSKNIFDKVKFSINTPEIISEIEKQNRKQIIIIGIESHVCVYQSVRDLIAKGYEVFLAIDAISSRTLENKKIGIDLMQNMGAIVSSTESLVFDMLEKAGSPEFKTISSLIK